MQCRASIASLGEIHASCTANNGKRPLHGPRRRCRNRVVYETSRLHCCLKLRTCVDATSFGTASDLASALRRAEAAHGVHEKRIGQRDANWPDWYAAYLVAEQTGGTLPS